MHACEKAFVLLQFRFTNIIGNNAMYDVQSQKDMEISEISIEIKLKHSHCACA